MAFSTNGVADADDLLTIAAADWNEDQTLPDGVVGVEMKLATDDDGSTYFSGHFKPSEPGYYAAGLSVEISQCYSYMTQFFIIEAIEIDPITWRTELTAPDGPDNEHRLTLGPVENVEFQFNAVPACGNVSWTATAGVLSASTGFSTVFTAPAGQGSATIGATWVLGAAVGVPATVTTDTKLPILVHLTKVPQNACTPITFVLGSPGYGEEMKSKYTLKSGNRVFNNCWFTEVTAPWRNKFGFLLNPEYANDCLWAAGGPSVPSDYCWAGIDQNNQITPDTASAAANISDVTDYSSSGATCEIPTMVAPAPKNENPWGPSMLTVPGSEACQSLNQWFQIDASGYAEVDKEGENTIECDNAH